MGAVRVDSRWRRRSPHGSRIRRRCRCSDRGGDLSPSLFLLTGSLHCGLGGSRCFLDRRWLLRRLCRCRLLYRPFFLTGATFFAVAPCAFAAALCNRQRFFVAAMILAIPSLLIRRLVFGAFGVAGNVPLIAAVHWIKHFAPSPTHFRPSSIRTSSVAKPCSSLG